MANDTLARSPAMKQLANAESSKHNRCEGNKETCNGQKDERAEHRFKYIMFW